MADLLDTQVYSLVGEEGLEHLIATFYRLIRADDLIGPMYPPDDFAGAEHRLREFIVQRFGGPDRYSRQRGHPRLRMRHAPFRIDQAARDRWVSLMEQAMAETALPAAAEGPLRQFFHDAATFMINGR